MILLILAVALAVFLLRSERDKGPTNNPPLPLREETSFDMPCFSAAMTLSTTLPASGRKEKAEQREWNLLLINPWNEMPEDFSVELADLPGGHQVDARCRDQLLEMLEDCRRAGLSPLICSSYRTQEKQQSLYDNKVSSLMARGMGREDARRYAASTVAYPGTSEHQIGLAVDIVDESYQILDTGQEKTAVQQWLMENSWRYGFILRYPNDKSDLTGIIYEPWHYRYVGKDIAREIYERHICLEEYLQ